MINEDSERSGVGSCLPDKIKCMYSDFNLISQTATHFTLEAKSISNKELHTIRVLNITTPVVKNDYYNTATLFIQELLRLCCTNPQAVLTNTFEFNDEKMVYATMPFAPLNYELGELTSTRLSKLDIDMDRLVRDVMSDVEYLVKDLKLGNCAKHLTPDHIYRFRDSGAFFLGDWSSMLSLDTSMMQESLQLDALLNVEKEIFELGLTLVEVNGTNRAEAEKLLKTDNPKFYEISLNELLDEQPEPQRELIKKMLTIDPKQKLDLSELSRSTISQVSQVVKPNQSKVFLNFKVDNVN